MITLVLVLLFISMLILAHEWGHFYSARRLGIRVDEFGFGFPPKIFSKVRNGVRYSVNLLPFGGFVKIFGEQGEGEGDRKSFISRPIWQRLIVLSAGVFMNIVLAWSFFSVGSMFGVPTVSESRSVPVAVVEILPGSPADRAGVKFGDRILEMRSGISSVQIDDERMVRDFAESHGDEEVTLVVRRGSEDIFLNLVPRKNYPAGEGPMGIALARLSSEPAIWYEAPVEGAKTLARSVVLTINGLAFIIKELAVEHKTSVAVSGPVGIFTMIDDSRSLGAAYLLQLAGLLSVNLAILNFLPIPALDGGRVLFLAIEKVRGKRVGISKENVAHAIGFALLIFLMLLVTYKDLTRIF